MIDYSKSLIYLLSYGGYFYVGSTTTTLLQRLKKHQKDYQSFINGKRNTFVSSFIILEKCLDCKIETLEIYNCKNRKELTRKEGEYIKIYKKKYADKCVNLIIAGRTDREYYLDNKEHLDNYYQYYRNKNRLKINKKNRETYQSNKDKYKTQRTQYRNTIESKEHKKKYDTQRRLYIKSWGKTNNLLCINIFNEC